MAIIKCKVKSVYWHFCDAKKEPQYMSPVYKAVGFQPDQTGVSNIGIPVETGDLIGYADNTGASTGDHLHFSIKPCLINEANGIWYNVEQKNGFNGSIDPQPYFDNYTPKKFSILKKLVELYRLLINALLVK